MWWQLLQNSTKFSGAKTFFIAGAASALAATPTASFLLWLSVTPYNIGENAVNAEKTMIKAEQAIGTGIHRNINASNKPSVLG